MELAIQHQQPQQQVGDASQREAWAVGPPTHDPSLSPRGQISSGSPSLPAAQGSGLFPTLSIDSATMLAAAATAYPQELQAQQAQA